MTDTPERAFLRPGKVLLLLLVALLVYGVTLVALLPAGWVWQQASAHVSLPPQVTVNRVSGTVWQGAAAIGFQGRDLSVGWQMRWPDLGDLALPVAIQLASARSHIDGRLVVAWPLAARLDATGSVHVPEFEDLIRASGGAMLAGDISIDRLQVIVSDKGLESARGLGQWPGGTVTWPMGDGYQSTEFPAMQATLDDIANGVSLTVSRQGESAPAAEANVLTSGMLEVRVYRRMIDLAGQTWSAASQPGDVVFQVSQPLLPGGRS